MNTLDQQILEELVYERVKVSVDLIDLLAFEEDLDLSIHRAVDRLGGPQALDEHLARKLVDMAWERLRRDLDALRDGHDNDDCPLCRLTGVEGAPQVVLTDVSAICKGEWPKGPLKGAKGRPRG